MVDYALDENVSALLISGDLFDGNQRSAKTAAFLLAEFDRLASQGVEVFYIKGNHDAENPVTGGLQYPDNVHVFSGRGNKKQLGDTDVWIHGVSFSGKHAPESLLDRFSAPEPHGVNIAMLHTSLAGSAGHDVYAPCSVDELKQHDFDYWALGHIHKRQIHSTSPWIVMPGIPQGRDIGEPGAKTATVLTIAEGKISTSELPTSSMEFVALDIDITEADTADALRNLIRSELNDLVQNLLSPGAIVRVGLTGQSSLRWQLIRDQTQWHESISLLATDTGCLWLEKLKLDLSESPGASIDVGAIGELEIIMNAIRADDWFAQQASVEIETALAQLPAAQRKRLLSSENELARLVEQLGCEGSDYVLAAMRGEGS